MIGPELLVVERVSIEIVASGRVHVGFRELTSDGGSNPEAPIAVYEACNQDDAGDRREIVAPERDAKPADLRCQRCLPEVELVVEAMEIAGVEPAAGDPDAPAEGEEY